MDFDYVNERAKKYSLSVERDAYIEGVRHGFHLASEKYLEHLINIEKIQNKSVIIIKNDESK